MSKERYVGMASAPSPQPWPYPYSTATSTHTHTPRCPTHQTHPYLQKSTHLDTSSQWIRDIHSITIGARVAAAAATAVQAVHVPTIAVPALALHREHGSIRTVQISEAHLKKGAGQWKTLESFQVLSDQVRPLSCHASANGGHPASTYPPTSLQTPSTT